MYPRTKNWSFNRTPRNSPNRAIEIMNPDIITAEVSENGTLLDGKGKPTEITFKPKPKAKAKPVEPEHEQEEPRKKPAQRLIETLSKEKKEVIRPITLMATRNSQSKKIISDADKKRIRDIISGLE